MTPSRETLLEAIRQKRCRNVRFDDLCSLVEKYGWVLDRIAKNNHYYYIHPEHPGIIINIPKPHSGNEVKRVYCKTAIECIQEISEYDDEQ
jgi:hypothetical protein